MRVILTAGTLVTWGAADLTPGRSETVGPALRLEQVRLVDELSAWVGVSGAAADVDLESSLPFPQDLSLTASARARARSFEIFCAAPVPLAAQRELLVDLPFAAEIERAASVHRVDALLVAAMVEAESSFEPEAESHKGAIGLMQVMPRTALAMGVLDLEQPVDNIEAGTRYLRQLLDLYDGDITLALAAYNAGPSRVHRFGGIPPYPETTRYVEKVLRRFVEHRRSAIGDDPGLVYAVAVAAL